VSELLSKLFVGGGIGFLIGLAFVWWVEPTTSGGAVLLTGIFVVLSAVVGGIVAHFTGRKKSVRQTPAIFISYRREDSGWSTQALYNALSGEFGADRVFMDVYDIGGGDDFVKKIIGVISGCDALIAVIGPRWISASNAEGRRLDDPNDYVRLEIRTALECGLRVVPLLVDDAPVPAAEQLPPDLERLVRLSAVKLGKETFRADAAALVDALKGNVAPGGGDAMSSA
jgi:hypothetical protein